MTPYDLLTFGGGLLLAAAGLVMLTLMSPAVARTRKLAAALAVGSGVLLALAEVLRPDLMPLAAFMLLATLALMVLGGVKRGRPQPARKGGPWWREDA